MMKKTITNIMAALVLVVGAGAMAQSGSTTVQTQVEDDGAFFNMKRPHFGVTLGVSEPEGSYDAAGEIGVNVGYQPFVPFGFGASLSSVRNLPQEDRGPDVERTTLLARGTYHISGEVPVIRHSWFGVAMGPVFSDDGTDFAIAPIAGFDIPIDQAESKNYMSLGADAQYLVVNNDQPDSLTVSGVVKFWY